MLQELKKIIEKRIDICKKNADKFGVQECYDKAHEWQCREQEAHAIMTSIEQSESLSISKNDICECGLTRWLHDSSPIPGKIFKQGISGPFCEGFKLKEASP